MWLLIPFVLLPIIEIALFVQIGGMIGVGATILWVLLSAILGIWIMRRQGMAAMVDLQRAVEEFRDPARPLAHGALVMVAGVLLVMPGFLTDTLGLLLLLPPLRSLLLGLLGRRVKVTGTGFGTRPEGWPRDGAQRPTVIDAEYVVVEETGDDHGPGSPRPDVPPPDSPRSDSPRPASPRPVGPRRPSGWTQH